MRSPHKVAELDDVREGTKAANDRGGQTYAGISRRANPDWEQQEEDKYL